MSVATRTRTVEALERAGAVVLGLVAVDGVGLDAGARELLREAVGAVLGLHEDEDLAPVVRAHQVREEARACARGSPGAGPARRGSAGVLRRATSTVAGLFMKVAASLRISSGKVAENSRFCRVAGRSARSCGCRG